MSASHADAVVVHDGPVDSSDRKRILLIEDDPNVAETFSELLELEGYQVTVARDGSSGLEAALREPFELVLCDLTLHGDMDGCDFARSCRQRPDLSDLHLVAVSGYCGPEDRQRAEAAGFDLLIAKPVDISQIHAAARTGRQG